MEDSFTLQGTAGGYHTCIVHEPLGISLFELTRLLEDRVFPEDLLKAMALRILFALDFFHSEAQLIHTGNSHLNTLIFHSISLSKICKQGTSSPVSKIYPFFRTMRMPKYSAQPHGR